MKVKRIQSDEKIGFKLKKVEKSLLLDGCTLLTREQEVAIMRTPATDPIMLTLEDWDGLCAHAWVTADRARVKAKAKRLEAIARKIMQFTDGFIEDECPLQARLEEAKVTQMVDQFNPHQDQQDSAEERKAVQFHL